MGDVVVMLCGSSQVIPSIGTDIGGVIGFDSLFLSGIKVTDLGRQVAFLYFFVAFQMTFAGIP